MATSAESSAFEEREDTFDDEGETVYEAPEEKPQRENEDRIYQTNPRFEFLPHVRSMDQFHIREMVRVGRHMKGMKGGRQMR